MNKVEQQKESGYARPSGKPGSSGYFWLWLGFIEFGRWLWVGFRLPEGLETAARRAATLTTMQTPAAFPLLKKRAFTVGL